MLAAALLHDVGKAQGRVPFWTRPAIVLGKKLAPGLLKRLVVYPGVQGYLSPRQGSRKGAFIIPRMRLPYPGRKEVSEGESIPGWRCALSYAWYHAEVGAELAAAAGLSQRAVLYIRTHHQADGPAAELHEVDEVS